METNLQGGHALVGTQMWLLYTVRANSVSRGRPADASKQGIDKPLTVPRALNCGGLPPKFFDTYIAPSVPMQMKSSRPSLSTSPHRMPK